jgi:hypothetical protein
MLPPVFWLFVASGTAVACASATPAECDELALAKLEASYLREAAALCHGQAYESCDVLPAIREKYREKRRKWVACPEQ